MAVTVGDMGQAVAVLAAAADVLGGRAVLLLSPPGAAAWLGAQGFAAIVAEAVARVPGVAHLAALDCADAPGPALAALRAGLRRVVLAGAHPSHPAVAAAGREVGAQVWPARPAALDLAGIDLARPQGRARLRFLLAQACETP